VVAKVRERLSVRKQAAQRTDVDRYNLKKLSEIENRKQFQIELSNRFEALMNLNDSEDINRAWENIKKNIKILAKETLGLYGRKQHRPWFDEECSQFLGQRKQARHYRCRKLVWITDLRQHLLFLWPSLVVTMNGNSTGQEYVICRTVHINISEK
jgi:hypothetical protein